MTPARDARDCVLFTIELSGIAFSVVLNGTLSCVMALLNKLFSKGKTSGSQETVCNEKLVLFNKDQVRVVLFRECDFRGRKLLFDSQSVQKIDLATSQEIITNDVYVEISNGYGYQYVKPCPDISHLAEMVFGAVAMSYKGTSLKIHSLKFPPRLMCSQIFPTPRYNSKICGLAPAQNCTSASSSLEHSVRLDDSGRSSANSISDKLSVNSVGSDTLLVSRGPPACSFPLDVPSYNAPLCGNVAPCSNLDSGEQSYNSVSSGLHSLPACYSINEGVEHSFSCGSLYKRWLRSSSASFEHSINLLTGSVSADDCLLKPHPRNSKLGLAVIVELPVGQEELLERFLMEHTAHLESLVWRTRQGAEIAYVRHSSFVSLMFEAASNAVQWLVDLLTGPQLAAHMWITLSPICDKFTSINRNISSVDMTCKALSLDRTFSFSKFLNEWAFFKAGDNAAAARCVTELCELLDCVDVKHTNFFVSTLVTAVLTHHLGWVATVLPPSVNDAEKVSRLPNPCNPLWGQLTDLYGATGRPSKTAQTIVTGSNRPDLITKILNSLTYFIRCNGVERKCVRRPDVPGENHKIDCVLHQKHRCKNKSAAKMQKDIDATTTETIELRHLNNPFKTKDHTLTKSKTLVTLNSGYESPPMLFESEEKPPPSEPPVIFVLGDTDQLINLKKKPELIPDKTFAWQRKSESSVIENKSKRHHSGVKFNFQQYPQIVTNYMRGKNLELSRLPIDKTLKFSSVSEYPTFDFFVDDSEVQPDVEILQTPSNASELEFTSDLVVMTERAVEKRERKLNKTFVRVTLPNTVVREVTDHPLKVNGEVSESQKDDGKMQVVELVLPRSEPASHPLPPINYTASLMRGIGGRYLSDMVLQGTTAPKSEWEGALRRDLSLAVRHSLLDQPIDEAVAIVANTDTWEVQLLSSHTYVIDRGTSGVRVGMSQLVSNMLESLLFMWKLHTPPEYCIMHIEQRLQEFCMLSKALSELLLTTEFCSMELLTSVLHLEVNDVPLLMAVASTHSPQVAQKYGVSFQ